MALFALKGPQRGTIKLFENTASTTRREVWYVATDLLCDKVPMDLAAPEKEQIKAMRKAGYSVVKCILTEAE